MNSKDKLRLLLPIALLTYISYSFLREAGHAIFMILYGAEITDFDFLFNPHVSGSTLAISTSFTESVKSAGGLILPYLISFFSVIITVLLIILAWKKGILSKYKEIYFKK